MTDADQQSAFIQAICESPHDDGPREMFADWLMDRGDPRGEFIRVQCKCRYGGDVEACRLYQFGPCKWCHRAEEIVSGTAGDLLKWQWFGSDFNCNRIKPRWHRGFVESIACRMQDWLDHGEQLVLTAPIIEVRITDREPYRMFSGRYGWHNENAVVGPSVLPDRIWDKLTSGMRRRYDTVELARADLSCAAVAWARDKAGLPELEK